MDSPRIPKAYGHYESDAAVATSHHAGVSLTHVLSAQREGVLTLGAGTAIDIAIEIAHAVRHASGLIGVDGQRIAHGHLNPNLVRTDAIRRCHRAGLGQPERRVAAYTAPEVMNGEPTSAQSGPVGHRSDAHRDDPGRGPLQPESPMRRRPPATATWATGYWLFATPTPSLDIPLKTMMSRDPGDRFARGHEVLKAAGLREAHRRDRQPTRTPRHGRWHTHHPTGRRRRLSPSRHPADRAPAPTGAAAGESARPRR